MTLAELHCLAIGMAVAMAVARAVVRRSDFCQGVICIGKSGIDKHCLHASPNDCEGTLRGDRLVLGCLSPDVHRTRRFHMPIRGKHLRCRRWLRNRETGYESLAISCPNKKWLSAVEPPYSPASWRELAGLPAGQPGE